MKKLLISLGMGLIALSGFAHEKGDMAAGINIGFAPCLEKGYDLTNFGIGAKYQYNVTKPIRLEADLEYWFKAQGLDVFDISANVQYLFTFGKITAYPTIGIGYGHLGGGVSGDLKDALNDLKDMMGQYGYDYDDDFDGGSASKFLFNIGIGAEYAITDKISAGLEIKYQFMKDFGRLPITIGATYKF